MAKRDQDVHFLASKEEVERIHQKMDELGIRSMGAYLRKMALDGYCITLDLQERLDEIWADMKEVLVRLSSIQ